MKIILLYLIFFSVTHGEEVKQKSVMIDTLLSLPNNMCYEETPDSFKKRIMNGKFSKDKENDILYLLISGDGSFGERLFILHKDKSLYMIIMEKKEGKNELQIYKLSKKIQYYIGSIPIRGEINISMPQKPQKKHAQNENNSVGDMAAFLHAF